MKSVAELQGLIERGKRRAEQLANGGFSGYGDVELMDDLASALGAFLPEERVGRCFCDKADAIYWVLPEWAEEENEWNEGGWGFDGEHGGPLPYRDAFCLCCGAELCADGVARRNADAGRVERVRGALDKHDKLCRMHSPTVSQFNRYRALEDGIRAALDGPQEVRDEQP